MMSGRKCPRCGERLDGNSLTCPKCYAEVSRETPVQRDEDRGGQPRKKVSAAVVLLAVIPAFFGILGLGQIYRDHRERKGYYFLIVGLVIFIPLAALFVIMLNSGLVPAIFLFFADVLLFILYLSAALAALLDALFGSVFRVLKF